MLFELLLASLLAYFKGRYIQTWPREGVRLSQASDAACLGIWSLPYDPGGTGAGKGTRVYAPSHDPQRCRSATHRGVSWRCLSSTVDPRFSAWELSLLVADLLEVVRRRRPTNQS